MSTITLAKAAPMLGGERGRDWEQRKSTRRTPWQEGQVLAALVYSADARATFVRLGIGPDYFDDDDVRTIARWALTSAIKPNAEVAAILRRRRDIADALRRYVPVVAYAERDVIRHAAAFARKWLPAFLRWWADRLEHADGERAEHEVRRLFAWLDAARGVAA